jgi:putative ABC transport system substrate-binding protein
MLSQTVCADVDGENVTVLYRYAENQIDRLPALAAELTSRPVTVIVASGGPNVISEAKKATTTIPIVFLSGEDPARLGLVASLARPGGNLTGINFFNRELVGKQLGFLRELVPPQIGLQYLSIRHRQLLLRQHCAKRNLRLGPRN